jgi:tetratricopeptide (TPR) repeat protein
MQQEFSNEYINNPPSRISSIWIIVVVILIIATIIFLIFFGLFPILKSQKFYSSLQLARTAWQNNQTNEIISFSEQALKLAQTDDEKSSAYYWMGVGYYRLGNLDKAEEYEKNAIQLKPDFAGPYVTLGAVMLDRGNLNGARSMAEKAIQLDPKYAWGYNLLGLVLASEGKKIEAIQQINKAIELDPKQDLFKKNLQIVEQQY